MAIEDRIARLVRLEMRHPEFTVAQLAGSLGVSSKRIALWRKRDEYRTQKADAIEMFTREAARVAAWKANQAGTAESIIEEHQAHAAQTIVMLMEDGTSEQIKLKASQDLLDRGPNQRGIKHSNEYSIDEETRKFLERLVDRYSDMTRTIDVESSLKSLTPVLPGESVPVLSDSSGV